MSHNVVLKFWAITVVISFEFAQSCANIHLWWCNLPQFFPSLWKIPRASFQRVPQHAFYAASLLQRRCHHPPPPSKQWPLLTTDWQNMVSIWLGNHQRCPGGTTEQEGKLSFLQIPISTNLQFCFSTSILCTFIYCTMCYPMPKHIDIINKIWGRGKEGHIHAMHITTVCTFRILS